MRKFLGFVVAAGLLVPTAAIVTSPAGAAGGSSCSSGKGSATFTPALPDLSSKTLVKDVLKSTGTVAGCSGTVKSGTLTGVAPASAKGSNCLSIATPTTTPTKITLTVKWNTGATTTIAAQLKEIPKTPVTTQTVSGTVTAGLFKGSKLSGKFTYKLPAGACSKGHPLAKLTYTNVGATVIK
jgi:hypothetical protein